MKLSAFGRVLAGSALCAGLVLLAPTDLRAQDACSTTNDVFMNPFNRQSAHHLPIGTGARYAGDNHPATRDWLRASRFNINVGGPWGVDVAAVTTADPMVQVNPRAVGPHNTYGLPVTIRVPRNGFETRVGTNQSGNTDGVAVIYDRSNGQTHQLRQYNWNNGRPTAGQYRSWDIRGLGHGTRPGDRVGTSASGVAALFGVLRGAEINTRGHRIEHALQIVLPYKRPNECNIMLGMDIVLPATTRDGHAGQAGANRGNIRYGELLALPPHVNLNALGLSEPGMRLAQAIRNYGIRVVDGGGCGAGAIRADQHVSSQVMNQLRNDIPKIYRHIRVVTNGEWRPGLTAIGGGQPLAPNCAFDASASQRNVSTPSSSPAASTPQSQPSSAASANQSQQGSGSSTGSAGGTLSWPAVRGANNYYVGIRNATGARQRVFGRMVSPSDGGCANGGTCRFTVPSLQGSGNYEWRVRAVVGGQPQSFSAWQPVNQSSAAAPAGNQGSSTNVSAPQSQPSGASSGSAGGTLSWPAVRGANNYYVGIRNATGARQRVFGRMVSPSDGGCATGGTCRFSVPSLPGSGSYEWRFRAVVGGEPQSFSAWQPVNQSSAAAPAGNQQSSTVASTPQSGSGGSSIWSGGGADLAWNSVPRANNYYVVVHDTTSGRERVYGRMSPPRASGCTSGGTCEHSVPSLPAGRSYEWNWRAVVDGEPKPFRGWRPLR